MNSTAARAESTRSVTCETPEWGAVFVESNTSVRLVERRDTPFSSEMVIYQTESGVSEEDCSESESLTGKHLSRACEWYYTPRLGSEDYDELLGVNGGVFDNTYNFFQILLRVAQFPNSFVEDTIYLDIPKRKNMEISYPNGGSSKGEEIVILEGRGFHVNESKYMAQFSRHSADIVGVSETDGRGRIFAGQILYSDQGLKPSSVTHLSFQTPPWGAYYSHGFTNASLLFGNDLLPLPNRSQENFTTLFSVGSNIKTSKWINKSEETGFLTARGTPVRSNPDEYEPLIYYFYQEWETISKHSGNSMGGSMVNISGFGFDPNSYTYTCRFPK